MHYFSNKLLKIAKRWGVPPPAPLNLQYWWPEVPWFGQIVVFEAQISKYSYDVITITSPKQRHKNFPVSAPPNQKFWLRQWFWFNNLIVFKKSGLGSWKSGFGLVGLTRLGLEKIGGLDTSLIWSLNLGFPFLKGSATMSYNRPIQRIRIKFTYTCKSIHCRIQKLL